MISRIRKAIIGCVILLVITIIWGYYNIWRSPKYYPLSEACISSKEILTMEEYGAYVDTHARPFILSSNNYLIYGSSHSNNPDDPQMSDIEEKWNMFKPTVALVEGRLGFLIPGLMDPIKNYLEMGKVKQLSKRHKIPIYNWDISREILLKEKLKKGFSPEQVALKAILGNYFSNLRFGKPDNPEKYVKRHFNNANIPELEGVITSIEQIDSIWLRDFPNDKDWRETSDEWGLPGYLREMGDLSNLIRNEHLTCVINDLIAKGERPFVIAGSSHAVCLKEIF